MSEQECLDWILNFLRDRKAMFEYPMAKGWSESYMEDNNIQMTHKEKQAWISGMLYGYRNACDDAIELLEDNGFDC